MTVSLGSEEDKTKLLAKAKYLNLDAGSLIRTIIQAFLADEIKIKYEINGKAIIFNEND